jgi:hypothetical protein
VKRAEKGGQHHRRHQRRHPSPAVNACPAHQSNIREVFRIPNGLFAEHRAYSLMPTG